MKHICLVASMIYAAISQNQGFTALRRGVGTVPL